MFRFIRDVLHWTALAALRAGVASAAKYK